MADGMADEALAVARCESRWSSGAAHDGGRFSGAGLSLER
jgi:hypothetical protein